VSSTPDELDQFHEYATEQLRNGGAGKSLEELLEQWRSDQITDAEFQESLMSLRRGLDDVDAGRVYPARTIIDELRRRPPTTSGS
jgi:hypothetical protein